MIDYEKFLNDNTKKESCETYAIVKYYNPCRYFDFDCHSLAWDGKSFYSDRGYKIIEWD